MQNNYRVFYKGKEIFGQYENPPNNVCEQILHGICPQPWGGGKISDPQSLLLDIIAKTVSQILERETLLSNIVSMQKLDVIDGDGAAMIYDRLVYLCKGSNFEAEKLVDEAILAPQDGSGISINGTTSLGLSPYTINKCDNTKNANEGERSIDNLLQEICHFRAYLCKNMQKGSCPDEYVMNASHAKCVESVSNLSKKECIFLLQNWLLSLSICDVSLFITFQFFADQDHTISDSYQSCENGGIMSCLLQGYGPLQGNELSAAIGVQYKVKVVDCDPKPARKLGARGEAENKFHFIGMHKT